MKNTTYHLMILKPAPSMNQDRFVFTAESYAEAVAVAVAAWQGFGRSVTLHSGEYDTYYWHRIDANGVSSDRNFNSGVPAERQLERTVQTEQAMMDALQSVADAWGCVRLSGEDRFAEVMRAYRLRLSSLRIANQKQH